MTMVQQQTTKETYCETDKPQTSADRETTGIDKDANYGRYQRPTDDLAKLHVKDRQWKSQLGKQVAHKALDEPFLGDDDEMKIDVDNRKEIHSGMGWKELAVMGALIVGTGGMGAMVSALLFSQNKPSVEAPIVTPPEADNVDSDTMFIPKIRFGPDAPGSN